MTEAKQNIAGYLDKPRRSVAEVERERATHRMRHLQPHTNADLSRPIASVLPRAEPKPALPAAAPLLPIQRSLSRGRKLSDLFRARFRG